MFRAKCNAAVHLRLGDVSFNPICVTRITTVVTDGTKIHKHAVSLIIIHLFIFYKLFFPSEDYVLV